MAHRKIWMVLFLAVLILVTTGCGSETGSSSTEKKEPTQKSSTKLIEPCELITKSEAEVIMDEALKNGQYSENKVVGQKICFYETVDENSFVFFQISLTQNAFIPPKTFAYGQSAQTMFSAIKKAFPDGEIINGTGDDAFIAPPGIHILYGHYYLTLGAGNSNQNRDKLNIASAKAMANLEAALK